MTAYAVYVGSVEGYKEQLAAACQQELSRRRREQTPEVLAAAKAADAIELEQWMANHSYPDGYMHILARECDYWVYGPASKPMICTTEVLLRGER